MSHSGTVYPGRASYYPQAQPYGDVNQNPPPYNYGWQNNQPIWNSQVDQGWNGQQYNNANPSVIVVPHPQQPQKQDDQAGNCAQMCCCCLAGYCFCEALMNMMGCLCEICL